jgi:hypothetical protein
MKPEMKSDVNSEVTSKTRSQMKPLGIALALFLLATTTTAMAQSSVQQSFDQLKTLAGSWQGKNSEGKPLTVKFYSTANGSALMSEIMGDPKDSAHKEDMISMFHLDGPNRLLLTHYCSAGNQPRFQATVSPDGKTFTFDFVDGTNIASPEAGHMQRVVFTILDPNHHTEDWIFAGGGKEMKEFFDLRRS